MRINPKKSSCIRFVLALGWSAAIYQPLMIPNCPGAITLDILVFISGHQDRLPVPVTQSTLCIVLSTQFSEKLGELHLRML